MNALKKINARVKVLQKKHPKSKRTALQKQAGREWKAGKLRGKIGSRGNTSGNTRTATKASTSRNRTATSTKTITAHIKVGASKKKRVVKKSTSKKLSVKKPKSRRVYKARVVPVRSYKAARYRRISGIGKMSDIMPIVAVAGLGLVAYYLISRNSPQQYQQQFAPTSNPYREQAQNSILQWALVAGMTATAITNIIKSLNKSSDDSVIAASSNPGQWFNPLGEGI